MKQPRRLVAYSGSADSTAVLRSLVAEGRGEIITLTVDLGQAPELAQIRDAALAAGAVRAHVVDARDELARAHLLPALAAGVPSGGWLPLVRSLGRPLVAAKLQEVAGIEDAPAACGAESHDVDASIAGRVVVGGAHTLTTAAAAAPEAAADVALTFDRGVPVAINDVTMPLTELIESLTTIAGRHGVGRVEGVEAPAAVVLHAALRLQADGQARLKLFKGTITPLANHDGSRRHQELVTQS